MTIDTETLAHAAMMADMSDPGDPEHQVSQALLDACARLAALEAELAEANDSLARSRYAYDQMVAHDVAKIERLEAENRRLRQSLQQIAEGHRQKPGSVIAQKAIAEGGG